MHETCAQKRERLLNDPEAIGFECVECGGTGRDSEADKTILKINPHPCKCCIGRKVHTILRPPAPNVN